MEETGRSVSAARSATSPFGIGYLTMTIIPLQTSHVHERRIRLSPSADLSMVYEFVLDRVSRTHPDVVASYVSTVSLGQYLRPSTTTSPAVIVHVPEEML